MTKENEGVVEELLRERREEVARDNAEEATYRARPGGPMTRTQFRARLQSIEARHAPQSHAPELQRQAA
jgi:hypothetical protein